MTRRSKGRKRNKSSPLLQSSPKKSKHHKRQTADQTDIPDSGQTAQTDHSSVETELTLEHDSTDESLSLLKSPVSRKPSDSNYIDTPQSSIMQDPDQTLLAEDLSGIAPELAASKLPPPPPSLMNPVVFNDQYAMTNHLLQIQQPVMSALSEQDIARIAHAVKSMLINEISQLVQAKVNSATATLQSELDDLKCKYNSLKEEVASLHKKQDDTEQYSRRMCLRISGISETQNEDVTKVVLDFAKRVNVKIGPGDIDRAHRVGRSKEGEVERDPGSSSARPLQNREIIIKFTNSAARLNLLRGRAKLREDNIRNIFINEDLTPFRKLLAFECRRIIRTKTSKIKKTWVYAGYPHILDVAGNKVRITSMSELERYEVKGTGRQIDT